MFKAEMEKEEKKRLAQQEIARFRERVSVDGANTQKPINQWSSHINIKNTTSY